MLSTPFHKYDDAAWIGRQVFKLPPEDTSPQLRNGVLSRLLRERQRAAGAGFDQPPGLVDWREAQSVDRRGRRRRKAGGGTLPRLLSFGAMDTLELGLKGKVAIVTGGSEGLGRAAVERLARSGARVTACARRKDVLERAVEDIRKATGADILALSADVSTAAGCEAVVAATVGQFGGVDILLNNAGTSAAASFDKVDDRAWQADFDCTTVFVGRPVSGGAGVPWGSAPRRGFR